MKLAVYSKGEGKRLGLVIRGGIVDLASHVPSIPTTMTGLIGQWDRIRDRVTSLEGLPCDHEMRSIRLHAPIDRPGKILGIGLNYADHARETRNPIPTEQFWFSKPATAVNDPYGDIFLPRVSECLDYEVELVFVVGKRCKHVDRAGAKAAIFGFMVGNDTSVRDWQSKTSQVILGKSFDSHAPMGPWLVTSDEIDPHALSVECFVNGERRQSSNTREMVFDCYAQLELLSKVMTLEPGDTIFSGTPGGVGASFKPPRWLRVGDVVRTEIQGIGHLENRVVPEP